MREPSVVEQMFIVLSVLLSVSVIAVLVDVMTPAKAPAVTWVTTIPTATPVDAGAKKLNLEIGIRADGVLVGALSTTASATINIKGEQTP